MAMPSPWLAVEANTDPLTRARELERSWERLLADGALALELPPGATAGLRPPIVESWRRSLATGLDPTELLVPIEADESEVRERWLEHPLGSLAYVLEAQLRVVAEETQSLVGVTDASGLLLHVAGAEWLKERAREMNFLEGARLSEAVDGTNGIGTALAADHALQVFAFEHFNQRHHQWICSSAPVHDPVSGRLVGIIDLSSFWKIGHPRSLELVTTAARTIERSLLVTRRHQDARLRRRYGDFLTRSTDLLINRDGYALDRDESKHPTPLEVPEDGGEVVLDDGSVALAEPLGQGEAYLVRRPGSRGAKSAHVGVLEGAEERARELATEQAALRQIATLVARESPAAQLFAVVTEKVAQIFEVPFVKLVSYEPDGSTVRGSFSEGNDDAFPIGSCWTLDSPALIASVRESGRPARVEDDAHVPEQTADVIEGAGMRSAVASPIVVKGRLWGAMVIASPRCGPLPEDTEARLADFTELVATAIANAESRAELAASEARARELAEEQAALRRVATLVARAPASEQFFSTVAREVASVLKVPGVLVERFEADGSVVTVGAAFDSALAGADRIFSVGNRMPPDPGSLVGQVFETHGTARVENFSTLPGTIGDLARAAGLGSGCGDPIVVDGELWGLMCVLTQRGTVLPVGTENRLRDFIELVATAIANYEARAELAASEALARELASEQAALRRVATLVAQGASPVELFSAVAKEVAGIIDIPVVCIHRYEADGTFTVVAAAGETSFKIGSRWPVGNDGIARMVLATGRPSRKDDYTSPPGLLGDAAPDDLMRSTVGVPIIVESSIWGFMVAAAKPGRPIPADTEERLARFTELVATAVSNATTRSELLNSRARVVSAADETRRRLERDLHDGIQQWLVALALRARKAADRFAEGASGAQELSGLADDLVAVTDELRELSRGIHPAILSDAGLDDALDALARRSSLRVDLDVGFEGRYDPTLEATVYYVAAESITNAVKHAQASTVTLRGGRGDGTLDLEIRDDGVGGADPRRGTGLIGLKDRVDTLGGTISFASPAGAGTTIRVKLPAGPRDGEQLPLPRSDEAASALASG